MRVPYKKMHGTGNIILVVDQRARNLLPPSPEKIRELGHENSGPGFDQMMWVGPATNDDAIASYRVFNADGGEVEQCGNGVRCVAKVLSEPADEEQRLNLQGPTGTIAARVFPDGQVAVSMGVPRFEASEIPFLAEENAVSHLLEVGEQRIDIAVVSLGNPHCVIPVNDVATALVGELAPQIQDHERFPASVNVGFARIVNRNMIELRVYERGVGETLACGTGACAAVVSGQRRGQLAERVAVRLPGGQLVVSWRGGDTPVWLKGDAELISNGTVNLEE